MALLCRCSSASGLVCGRVRVVGKNAAFLCCYFVVKYTFGSAGSVCKSCNTILFSFCL